jgi:hypothetical protein
MVFSPPGSTFTSAFAGVNEYRPPSPLNWRGSAIAPRLLEKREPTFRSILAEVRIADDGAFAEGS